MKWWLITLLVLCTSVAAMVPRERRALPSDEVKSKPSTKSNICAMNTPCAWSIYKPSIKMIQMNITNTYCSCDAGTQCLIDEDDISINAYVHRCRPEQKQS